MSEIEGQGFTQVLSTCAQVNIVLARALTSSIVATVLRQSLILDWNPELPGDDRSSFAKETKSEILIFSGMFPVVQTEELKIPANVVKTTTSRSSKVLLYKVL